MSGKSSPQKRALHSAAIRAAQPRLRAQSKLTSEEQRSVIEYLKTL
jgi:hypothetical protein